MNDNSVMADIANDVKAISQIPIIPNLLKVICKTTGMGFSAVAKVTDTKWVTCAVRDEISFGLKPGDELLLETTICNEIRQSYKAVVIDHVDKDPLFKNHHTPLQYGFQSYISVPIFRKDGSFFGTLCAIDPNPAKLRDSETLEMFKLFTELISLHISNREELDISEASLKEEKKKAELREQFIGVLGHDLKNPLNAIMMSAQFLNSVPLTEETLSVVKVIKNSSYRMSLLIENILDFARGRLGGGITLNLKTTKPAQDVLNDVISELKAVWPNKAFEVTYNLSVPVAFDEGRIAQLFSNLAGNAIIHGNADTPVIINAETNNNNFILAVSNYGKQITETSLEKLFQPFFREENSAKKGLGLGLYIAHEIALGHKGTLTVTSSEEKTTFTFTMPLSDQ